MDLLTRKFLFLGLLALGCVALAQSDTHKETKQDRLVGQASRLKGLLGAYHDVYGMSGAIRISRKGNLVFEESIGLAQRAFSVAYTPDVRQPINSVSKVFTTVVTLRLVQDGALTLDKPIAHYLPELSADWAEQLTPHHLLSHTSGLPRETGLDAHSSLSFEQQMKTVEALPLHFEPGSEYGYSNAGFIILGYLLETISGKDYATLVKDLVLAPLSLENTGVLVGRTEVPRLATPYRMGADGVVTAQRTKTLGASAGGGLYSNGSDLHVLMQALLDDELLQRNLREQLVRVHSPEGGEIGEAYAFSIQAFGDKKIWLAAGSGYGAKSVVIQVPEEQLVVSILSNWGNTPIMAMLRDIYLILENQPVALPDRSGLASPEAFSAYLGRYQFDESALRQALQMDNSILRLHVSDNKLFLDDELMAAGEQSGTLRLTYTEELVIGFDNETMVLRINGQKLLGERIR